MRNTKYHSNIHTYIHSLKVKQNSIKILHSYINMYVHSPKAKYKILLKYTFAHTRFNGEIHNSSKILHVYTYTHKYTILIRNAR